MKNSQNQNFSLQQCTERSYLNFEETSSKATSKATISDASSLQGTSRPSQNSQKKTTPNKWRQNAGTNSKHSTTVTKDELFFSRSYSIPVLTSRKRSQALPTLSQETAMPECAPQNSPRSLSNPRKGWNT